MICSTPNLKNWLAIYHSDGVGPARFQKYLAVDPELRTLPNDVVPSWRQVEEDFLWLQKYADAAILTLIDPRYPKLLQQIVNPPPILFVRGDSNLLSNPQLAIVGSRNPSIYGLNVAKQLASHLSQLGISITSGLAQGIDGACHQATLAAGGKTIAILGCGIDVIYPARHKVLFEQIIQHGCLVSEFPLRTGPEAYNFPRRNRIISGLSLGVLVIEAALNSGSLITAAYALEQNREIFAIPGTIHNPRAQGCHRLIRQGAKLVEGVEDIIEELQPLLRGAIRDNNAAADVANKLSPKLPPDMQVVLGNVDYDTTSVDTIVSRSALPASVVGAMLLELELHSFVSVAPGGYVRN